jgi:membrane associated rhomboid family serine protease
MQELEVTWPRVFAICWLMFWRGVVGALVIGAVIGFIIGFVGALAGLRAHTALAAPIVGAIFGLIWWVYVVRMALRKHYADFRIALLPLNVRIDPAR